MHFQEVMVVCVWHDENEQYPKHMKMKHTPAVALSTYHLKRQPLALQVRLWSIFIIVVGQISELVLMSDSKSPKPSKQDNNQQLFIYLYTE